MTRSSGKRRRLAAQHRAVEHLAVGRPARVVDRDDVCSRSGCRLARAGVITFDARPMASSPRRRAAPPSAAVWQRLFRPARQGWPPDSCTSKNEHAHSWVLSLTHSTLCCLADPVPAGPAVDHQAARYLRSALAEFTDVGASTRERCAMTPTVERSKLTPNLLVADVERSLAFYTNVLGFERGLTVPDSRRSCSAPS